MNLRGRLAQFAYETFRPHSAGEYGELFTRGGGGAGKNPYPWFYSRVLLFGLLVFAAVCIGYSASGINFLMVTICGGIFFDLAFVALLYELYPGRDLPLLTPLFAFACGAALSSALIYVGYGIANYRADFAAQAWTAFVEETGKAAVTVLFLAVLKRRSPLFCLMIGAAVGGGYSAFENIWLIYAHGFVGGSLSSAMQVALWRALGTPFSHVAWAGLFGMSLYGSKPWLSFRPYAAYAFGYVMHFFVNFPLTQTLSDWKSYPISAVTGIVTIVVFIYFVRLCVRPAAPDFSAGPHINGVAAATGEYEYIPPDPPARLKAKINALAAAGLFCLAMALIGPTCVFGGYASRDTREYASAEEFLTAVQGSERFSPDYDRPYLEYGDLTENYSFSWSDGALSSVVQRERYGDYVYRFSYGHQQYFGEVTEDEAGNRYLKATEGERPLGPLDIVDDPEEGSPYRTVWIWGLVGVSVERDESVYYAYYTMVDDERLYFYLLNPDVVLSTTGYDSSEGVYKVTYRGSFPVRMPQSIAFTVIFAAAALGCGTAYVIMKRRNKNVE